MTYHYTNGEEAKESSLILRSPAVVILEPQVLPMARDYYVKVHFEAFWDWDIGFL